MTTPQMCPANFSPAPSTMASFADNSQFPWMEIAAAEIGVAEIAGTRHNPRILEYFGAVRGNIRDDETAWCSAFANWVMREAGMEGTRRANARSWTTWGQDVPLASPHYGAIAVLWRGSPTGWQGHVAFYAGREGANIILLGGNQSDAVRLSPYPASRLLALRWPPNFPAPNMSVH